MRSFLPAFLRRPLLTVVAVLFFFVLLCVTAPDPARIEFGPAAEAPVQPPPASIPLADRLLPVHILALCLETLATRITVASDAAFEVFDHAYRDECRSPIAGDPDWRLAAEWFGEPFLPAVYGILDTERELVVRAVRDDAAAGRPVPPPCCGAASSPRWPRGCASSCACWSSPTRRRPIRRLELPDDGPAGMFVSPNKSEAFQKLPQYPTPPEIGDL